MVVTGQISDFKLHSSGHCYFHKDAVLSCVCLGQEVKINFVRKAGCVQLPYRGLYPGGKYRFADNRNVGIGALQLEFERSKLMAEVLRKTVAACRNIRCELAL
jgi:exonuclease VII large subunit